MEFEQYKTDRELITKEVHIVIPKSFWTAIFLYEFKISYKDKLIKITAKNIGTSIT